ETDRDSTFGKFFKRDGAWCFAFLPDNKTLLATGGEDEKSSQIRLWNLQSGQETHRFKADRSPIIELRVSSDGKQLTCYSQGCGSLRVWELPTGKFISQRQLKQVIEQISANLKIGIFNHFPGKPYHVWDLEADKELFQVDGKENWCTLAPDGRVLVV